MSDKLLLGLDQVAEKLSVSRRTVQALIYDGALPSVTISRRRLVSRTDLEAFVDRLRAENEKDREAWKPAVFTEGKSSARRAS